jgi:hypothetical protein
MLTLNDWEETSRGLFQSISTIPRSSAVSQENEDKYLLGYRISQPRFELFTSQTTIRRVADWVKLLSELNVYVSCVFRST